MSMTIDEIRTARRELEAQLAREISAAVDKFREATGINVRSIMVPIVSVHPLNKERATTYVSDVTVDLERL